MHSKDTRLHKARRGRTLKNFRKFVNDIYLHPYKNKPQVIPEACSEIYKLSYKHLYMVLIKGPKHEFLKTSFN